MKKTMRYVFTLLIMLLCFGPDASAQQEVKLTLVGNIGNENLKAKLSRQGSLLLTELNKATTDNRALNLNGINMSPGATASLQSLWKLFHISCDMEENVEKCLRDINGYQVRNIPVTIHPMEEGYDEETSRELFISFAPDGQMTGVHMAASNNVYNDVLIKGTDVSDKRRRLEILKFVEAFRSFYDEKDIKSLQQIYSDDALIITGKVIMKKTIVGDHPSLKPEIVYNKQNKTQYLERLSVIFKNNKFIKVTFDDIQVVRHPAKPNFYGVTLRQNWKTSQYEDDGYVFLLWEFPENEDEPPLIHIRTWQPENIGSNMLAKKDVFNINDFFIP